ncbi:MAG TPA: 50S ribosomal protein L25 [Alphaproteobacteria bacterium]|nr:50S ribosomal protein L25 [Alphaproteobacteria bacterium]
MTATPTTLEAKARPGTGTGAARAARRSGRIPAVVYGGAKGPEHISVNGRELTLNYLKGRFLSTIFVLDIDGEKQRVIPREVQLHPVTDQPVHADFMRLVEGARIKLFIPVHFKNQEESPGLKKGGVLNIVRHEVELYCPADRIPTFIEADLKEYDIADSLHISAFKLPEGVKPVIANRDFTVATIAPPTTYNEAAAAAAAPDAAAAGAAAGKAPAAAAGKAPAAGGKAPAAAAGKAPAAGGKAPAAAAKPAAAPAKKK